MSFRDKLRKLKSDTKSLILSTDKPKEANVEGQALATPASTTLSGHSPVKASDSWTYLKMFLAALEQAAKPLAPLRAAVTDLAECIHAFENIARERKEYERIYQDLEELFQELHNHCGQDVPPTVTSMVESLCKSIQDEVMIMRGKPERGYKSRRLEAQNDADAVLAFYRRVQGYLRRILLNINISVWRIVNELATNDRLKNLSPSLSACYNSAQAVELKRGPCNQGTRVELLAQMLSWVDSSSPGSVYWMNGMAGTGKTTIAYSLCQELDADFRLAASFFCSRLLPECRDINRIIPSIAYQLARLSHPFRAVLSSLLEKDPDVHTRLPHLQFDALLAQPLLEVRDTLPNNLVAVVDALDECENKEATSRILDVLLTKSVDLPVRFVVSSRPESEIRDEMTKQSDQIKSRVVLHELDKQSVQTDIETYLRATLAQMEPTEDQITALVQRAGILFIYAATAIRYIGYDKFRRNPHARLANVLNSSNTADNKHREIDELYSIILRGALDNPELDRADVEDMRQVLHSVVCAQEPLTVSALSGLLKMNDTGRIHAALRPLWSVLHVSGSSELITTLHASFPDYMLDPSRSKLYSCDSRAHNRTLALRCFDCFRDKRPQFNICKLESSYVPDDKVERLEERVQSSVSTELHYAARYWAVHVYSAIGSPDLMSGLEEFLSVRLLLWMEVMNLKKCTGAMPGAIRLVERWKTECSPYLNALIHDAWRFTSTFALGAVSRSTPHIYSSMFSFWPESSPISRSYVKRMRGLIKVNGTAIAQRQHALLATWYFTSITESPVFSPDGSQIAVGVSSQILLLNALTGQRILPPFEGHEYTVTSLGFSPDVFACGAYKSGETVLGPLKGHTDWVLSVAISPDGSRIISASVDEDIRIWDARTGDLVLGPLKGHPRWVHTINSSPEGRFMLCPGGAPHLTTLGSEERTVLQTLGGDDEGLSFTLAGLSPNATCVVSRGFSNCLYNYDVENGQRVHVPVLLNTPTADHSTITCVAFSPDGRWITCGSYAGTLCIWDAMGGDLVLGPLEGHTNGIKFVCFSPDGAYIVSGSHDKTLRLWDTQCAQAALTPHSGHADSVKSVGFSPDGARMVSGSEDRTVCTWDSKNGTICLGPLDMDIGHDVSVAFTPDCTHILSQGERGTTLLNAQTGDTIFGPLRRYNQSASVRSSSDGDRLACSSTNNLVNILSSDTGHTLMVIHPLPISTIYNQVTSATFSPDGTRIAIGLSGYYGSISMFEICSGRLLWGPLEEYPNTCRSVGFSPDGTRIVTGSLFELLVRDARSGEVTLGPLGGHASWINSIEFSPDGAYIVSGADDHAICIWDAQMGQPVLGPVKWHTAPVFSVKFSPDGTRIISGSEDNTIRVTDIPARLRKFTHTSPPVDEWVMNEDGWIVDGQGRLLTWVPPELRTVLMWPHTLHLMSKKGYVQLDFSDTCLGDSWSDCYCLDH